MMVSLVDIVVFGVAVAVAGIVLMISVAIGIYAPMMADYLTTIIKESGPFSIPILVMLVGCGIAGIACILDIVKEGV